MKATALKNIFGLCVICAEFIMHCSSSFASGPDEKYLAPTAVSRFYQDFGTRMVWDRRKYDQLLLALKGLSDHGLSPDHYHFRELSAASIISHELDELATDAWFSAAAHIVYGKLDPISVEPDWTAAHRAVDLSKILQIALNSDSVLDSLEALAPQQVGYQSLRRELRDLQTRSIRSPANIPLGPAIHLGDGDPRVAAIRGRLVELGYMPDSGDGIVFDSATFDVVREFQLDHDLNDDGIIGSATINALNRGDATMIDQVRVNLERWRWLPDDLGRRHVRVNIAGFGLSVWENGQQKWSHLVIVGKPYRKTPVFSSSIKYVTLNPWWETPPSIARRDKLMAFRKDPDSISRLGFQILDRNGSEVRPDTINWNEVSMTDFPFRLRQAPGPQNALGQVKIMFPNQHSVYIHDTPTRDLFSQRQRAFSSGCIRTQDPVKLTEWLLNNTADWSREQLENAIQSGKELRIDLAVPVPVHILYSTVVPEANGQVRYLDDIYMRDRAVLSGLDQRPD